MKKIIPMLLVGILVLSGLGVVAITDDQAIVNHPPRRPQITGPDSVRPGTYEWTFKAVDPDDDNVSYEIRWGDGEGEKWKGWYASDEEVTRNHTYYFIGSIDIRARAKDIHGAIGEWGGITFGKGTPQSTTSSSGIIGENSESLETNKENDYEPCIDLIWTFYPIDDTYASHPHPDENYGSSEDIRIANEYGVNGSSGWADVAYVRFDLWDLQDLFNREIASAELGFYYLNYEGTDPAGRDLNSYIVTSDWDEDTLTWNNQPTYEAEPFSSATVPSSAGNWIKWDVTSDIQSLIDNYEFYHDGYRILDNNYWGQPNIPTTMVKSKENESFHPYIEVVYQVSVPSDTEQDMESLPLTMPVNYQTSQQSSLFHARRQPECYECCSVNWCNGGVAGKELPTGLIIDGPTHGVVGVPYTYTFFLIDPEGCDFFLRIDWGDGTITDWFGPYASGTKVRGTQAWDESGNYTIKAVALECNSSHYYATLNVTITENHPPEAPEIDGPMRIKVGVAIEFTFSTEDPDGDNVSFYVDWGDGTSTGWTDYFESGTDVTIKHCWSEKGDILIMAKAKDIYGAESDWTNRWFSKNQNMWFPWWLDRFPLLNQIIMRLVEGRI